MGEDKKKDAEPPRKRGRLARKSEDDAKMVEIQEQAEFQCSSFTDCNPPHLLWQGEERDDDDPESGLPIGCSGGTRSVGKANGVVGGSGGGSSSSISSSSAILLPLPTPQ